MTTQPQRHCIGAHTVSGDFVMLDPEERRRHLYIIGQTGTGKSTLLLNLIAQDLAAGEGLALLDPHGDLAEAALLHIPRDRTNDLIYVNPAETERPIGFNPLSGVPEDLKPVVADGVVSAFRHVWPESWGPRLDYILTNAVRALLDVPGATLLMLPRLLIDEPFRVRLVDHHVGDPMVRSFWLNEYAGYGDHFRAEAISPIQNKIGKALIEPRLRNMLAQPKSTITLRRLMDERAIVICNLSKGRLGESVAHLLGALLTTSIAQAALSRADTPAADRRTFHLYADEFQSFATDSFALILSEARKYALTRRERSNFISPTTSLSMDTDFTLEGIRELNDEARRHFTDGVILTRGMSRLPYSERAAILQRVCDFEDFTPDNDPYDDHDFGAFEHNGRSVFWKIDYFDRRTMRRGSDDPSACSPSCSRRNTDPVRLYQR